MSSEFQWFESSAMCTWTADWSRDVFLYGKWSSNLSNSLAATPFASLNRPHTDPSSDGASVEDEVSVGARRSLSSGSC